MSTTPYYEKVRAHLDKYLIEGIRKLLIDGVDIADVRRKASNGFDECDILYVNDEMFTFKAMSTDIGRLKDLVLPFDNVFIEVALPETLKRVKKVAYQFFTSKVSSMAGVHPGSFFISSFTEFDGNKLTAITANMVPNKLPRFYMACTKVDDCELALNVIPVQLRRFSASFCMLTPRTCERCALAAAMHTGIQVVTHLFELLNKSPQVLNAKPVRKDGESRRGRKPVAERLGVTVIRRVRKDYDRKEPKGTHASPKTHVRRRHQRHYKDGKTVWIERTVVNAKTDEDRKMRGIYKLEEG